MRTILLLWLIISTSVAVGQQNNTNALQQKTQVLRRFLEQQHYQPLQWNDSASMRLFNRWMSWLDADKLLFSQTEIKQLTTFSTRLDEELLGKEWNFFDKSTALYKLGLRRADSAVNSVLSAPLDFSAADEISWPFVDYPTNRITLLQTWKKFLKWKVLRSVTEMVIDSLKVIPANAKQPADFAQLESKARARIKKQELLWLQNKLNACEQSGKEMQDNYLAAISWCYDPHTEYMSADTKKDFDTEISGLEYSVGFEMDENDKGEWEITYLVPGGPAWRNGELHKGDVLLKVKAGDKPELEMADADMEQLSKIFEGSNTEQISITVRSVGGAQKTVALSKEKITNEEGIVKSYVLNGSKKIGYITLPGFYIKEGDEENVNGCSNDVAKEVLKLKKDSISGLILDLRFNGGGSLGEALELAGIFINEGSLASTKDKNGKVHFLRDPNRGTIYDGPLLVMVNTLSASASELVAAVLQDYHRALIVGSTTHGKGSEQVVLPLDTTGNFSKTTNYESYVKVTDGKFYRVDGSTTQWKGVVPDIELPDIYALDKFREKAYISALQPDNSKPAIYQPLPLIAVTPLRIKSNQRQSTDKGFADITKFAAIYKTLDDVKAVPLQWSGYYNYFKKARDLFNTMQNNGNATGLKATNNSMDKDRQRLSTDQSKAINDINIKRIEKDSYIGESYKIMQDWLQ